MFDGDQTAGVHRWPIVKLRAGSKARVVLLSTRFLPIGTHWIKGTLPCPGEDCGLCEMLPVRTLFYVACMNDARLSLLELGSAGASHFEQHCKLLGGGMRPGVVLDVSRRTAQSPVYSEAIEFKENCKEVSLMDLVTHVMTVYRFPCPNPGEDLASYERRVMYMSQLRNKRLRDQMAVARK